MTFLVELSGLDSQDTGIGDVNLEADTKEKACFAECPEFGKLEGRTLVSREDLNSSNES